HDAIGNILLEGNRNRLARRIAVHQRKPEDHRSLVQESRPGHARSAEAREDHPRGEEEIPLGEVADVIDITSELERMPSRNDVQIVRRLNAILAVEVNVRSALAGDEQIGDFEIRLLED